MSIDPHAYAATHGPRAGDRIRLGDSGLTVRVESDSQRYGDEFLAGFGKTARDGLHLKAAAVRETCDVVISNVVVIDAALGIRKVSIGIREGRICSIGRAGNPDTLDGVDVVVGTGTSIVSGEGLIATAGAVDTHVHLLSPRIMEASLASGVTTIIGQEFGPVWGVGVNSPWALRHAFNAFDAWPVNIGFLGRGSSSYEAPLVEALAEGGMFEMVYLNRPRPEGELVFDREEIEPTFNRRRVVGIKGLPPDTRLVAGLDPAATRYQASFAWGWSDETARLYMIDADNRIGGGIASAGFILRDWFGRYGVNHWVIEENGFQRAIRQDSEIKRWAADNGVYLEGHQTQGNKQDPRFGVTSLVRLFRDRIIDLPYGNAASIDIVELFIRQLLNFTDTGTGVATRGLTDLPMAAWFPLKVIRRWQKESQAAASVNYDPVFPYIPEISVEGFTYDDAFRL